MGDTMARDWGYWTGHFTGGVWDGVRESEMVGEWVLKHGTIDNWLVVWNMTFIFHNILGIIIPTDFHIFSEGLEPPTR